MKWIASKKNAITDFEKWKILSKWELLLTQNGNYCQTSNLINFCNPYAVSFSLVPPIAIAIIVIVTLPIDKILIWLAGESMFFKLPFGRNLFRCKINSTTRLLKNPNISICNIAQICTYIYIQMIFRLFNISIKLGTLLLERNSYRLLAQKGNPGIFEIRFSWNVLFFGLHVVHFLLTHLCSWVDSSECLWFPET